MGKRLMAGACLLALCVGAGSAEARKALKCAAPPEVAAMQTAAIQQELMDAALTCGDQARTDFNAFQTSFNAELRRSDKTLLAMFRRVMGGSKGDAAYNLFKTDMASKAELRRVHGHADFCAAANLVISAALAPEKPSLNDFVSGVPVSDVAASEETPVGSCQLQVAVTLQGAMVSPAVLPRPNPLRVAIEEPPAAPAPTAPGNASAEPATPSTAAPLPSPAAEPPKEEPKKPESKGWLSNILN